MRTGNQTSRKTPRRKKKAAGAAVSETSLFAQVSITDFLSYRDYISALYTAAKSTSGTYSYDKLAEDLGLPPSNVLWLVVSGRRKLSPRNGTRIAKALGLTGLDKQYLLALITYNNVRLPEAREEAFQLLMILKNRQLPSPDQQQSLEYFSEWYHPVIRELVGLANFRNDPEWIASKLMFKVLPKEIRGSLDLLESLDLIKMDHNKNRFVQTGGQVHPDRKVSKIAAVRYHQKICEIAKEAITRVPAERRDFNAITVNMTEEAARLLTKRLYEVCEEVMALEGKVEDPDQVYQVNLQIFPFTKP